MKRLTSLIHGLSVFRKIMLITLVLAISIAINTSIAISQLSKTQLYLDELENTTYQMVLFASGNLPLLKRADELLVQSVSSGDGDLVILAFDVLDNLTGNLDQLSILDPENNSLIEEIYSHIAEYKIVAKRVMEGMASENPDFEKLSNDSAEKAQIFEASNEKLSAYHTSVADIFKGTLGKAASSGRDSLIKMSVVNAISLACLFIIIYLIARSISRSAIQVRDSLSELSKGSGDLTKRLHIRGSDELAQVSLNFNRFIDKLASIVRGIVELVPPLADASAQLDSNSSDVSKATENLLEKARLGKSAMDEMTLSINEISASASATSDAINATNDQANAGLKMVESTISNSQTLNKQILESSSFVNQLIDDAQGVATILDMISQIAEQTNLLALNAAIEAARAGDLGRGFAVVADEVRSLSLKTGEATRSIRAVLERLEKNASNTISSMEKATQQSCSTERQALETGEALRNIIAQIEEVKTMGLTIASATEEQSSVVMEVTLSISEMLEATLSTESVNNSMQDLSQKLLGTSSELNSAVSVFKVT